MGPFPLLTTTAVNLYSEFHRPSTCVHYKAELNGAIQVYIRKVYYIHRESEKESSLFVILQRIELQ